MRCLNKTGCFSVDPNLSQQNISQIEQKENIDDGLLEQISKIFKVPVEAIKTFDKDTAIYNIQNNYDVAKNNSSGNPQCTFNTVYKIVELYDQKIALYERMLKDKNEMIERLE